MDITKKGGVSYRSLFRVKERLDGPDATHRANREIEPTFPQTFTMPESVLTHGRTHSPRRNSPPCSARKSPTARETSVPIPNNRRRCSMKRRMIFGALLVSVAMASQGFGFELLDNLLGMKRGCNACCEPQCCDPVCATPCASNCAPACDPCCEPQCCDPCCEPQCCDPCEIGCGPCGKKCDLFAGLKGLFACKKSCCGQVTCCDSSCNMGCAPACDPCCEPQCCEPQCCEPKCCDPCVPACDPCGTCNPCCGKRCTPILDFIGDLFCCKKSCCAPCCGPVECCGPACCETNCCPTTCGPAACDAAPCASGCDQAAPQPATPQKAAPQGEKPGKLPAPKPKEGQASVNFRSLIRN